MSELSGEKPREPRRPIAYRAILTLVSACIVGLTLGGFAVRKYDDMESPSYRKLFDGLKMSRDQTRQTDSIFVHYVCAIDSVNNTVAPITRALRAAGVREIEAALTPAQIAMFRSELADMDRRHREKHGHRGDMCGRRTKSESSRRRAR